MPRMKRARAIAREMAEAEAQAEAMARGFERLERAFKRAGVVFYQNIHVNKGTWMWRHERTNFKAGPFDTKLQAMQHAQVDLIESGVWKP